MRTICYINMTTRELEEEARRCYSEPISLTVDQFVKMMLFNGHH
jgi:hypothetical protein